MVLPLRPSRVQDAEPLKKALSLTPEFLRAKGNTLDYKVGTRHCAAELGGRLCFLLRVVCRQVQGPRKSRCLYIYSSWAV